MPYARGKRVTTAITWGDDQGMRAQVPWGDNQPTWAPAALGVRLPCAVGTYSTREAGTRSLHAPYGGPGAYVSAQAVTSSSWLKVETKRIPAATTVDNCGGAGGAALGGGAGHSLGGGVLRC